MIAKAMSLGKPMASTVDKEAKKVAARIVNLVIKAEDERLIDSGVARATVDHILVNGTLLALVGVYHGTDVGDEGELVRILLSSLRGLNEFDEKFPRY